MNSKQDSAEIQFLKSFGPFCLALTINFKQRRFSRRCPNDRYWIEKDANYFVNMLNTLIFKRAFKYGHKALGIVCSFEMGAINSRPHLHLAIGKPPTLSQEQLLQAIRYVAYKMKYRLGDIYIKPYHSDGWLEYITKTNSVKDVESLIPSACFKPKY